MRRSSTTCCRVEPGPCRARLAPTPPQLEPRTHGRDRAQPSRHPLRAPCWFAARCSTQRPRVRRSPARSSDDTPAHRESRHEERDQGSACSPRSRGRRRSSRATQGGSKTPGPSRFSGPARIARGYLGTVTRSSANEENVRRVRPSRRQLLSELDVKIVSKAPHGAIVRDPDEETRSGRSIGLVHADELTFRVVREERFDVEPHQFARTQFDIGNERCLFEVDRN